MGKQTGRMPKPKLVTGMQGINRTKTAFTLIEIMVVLVIIGIALTFTVLAMGDFGATRRIRVSAEQFAEYIRFIQQQAVLEDCSFGIRVTQHGYQVLRYNPLRGFETLSVLHVFQEQVFPSQAVIRLDAIPTSAQPAIVIDSSGEFTPFTVYFESRSGKKIMVVTGKRDGTILERLK